MSFVPINPRPFLQKLVGETVFTRLKWGETEYKGTLVSIDSYMNIQLSDAEEHIPGEEPSKLGQVFIRCNNVLWIRSENDAPQTTGRREDRDTAMQG